MTTLYVLIGTTAGGYIGWWVGAHVGMMTAFTLSVVGTGVGLYVARRVLRHYGG